jgi:hypothetical protein
MNAHGRQSPTWWPLEPTVGNSGLPNGGSVETNFGTPGLATCGVGIMLANDSMAAAGCDGFAACSAVSCASGSVRRWLRHSASSLATGLHGADRTRRTSKKAGPSVGISRNVFRTTRPGNSLPRRAPSPGDVLLLWMSQ